jgi:hypothetical protein
VINSTGRHAAVVALLVFSAACGRSTPTSPTLTSPQVDSVTPGPRLTEFPPLEGPSRTFVFARELAHPVSQITTNSRFVLYDNGAFVVQYGANGNPGYRGGYKETDGVIRFDWQGWSTAGPWGATGRLNGNVLTVEFNLVMQMSDFEDAVYTLTP